MSNAELVDKTCMLRQIGQNMEIFVFLRDHALSCKSCTIHSWSCMDHAWSRKSSFFLRILHSRVFIQLKNKTNFSCVYHAWSQKYCFFVQWVIHVSPIHCSRVIFRWTKLQKSISMLPYGAIAFAWHIRPFPRPSLIFYMLTHSCDRWSGNCSSCTRCR